MPKWRGTKGQGLRFQQAAANAIRQPFQHGQANGTSSGQAHPVPVFPDKWFKYHDANGIGYCSPDILLLDGHQICIIECKLTWTPEAIGQITELYAPVVNMVYERTTTGIILARHLTPATPLDTLSTTLAQALAFARQGLIPTLHWLGHGPI